MGFQTDCIATGEERERFHGSVSPPIYAASLFTFSSYDEFIAAMREEVPDRYVYTRGLNPTVRVLEEKVAVLEQAEAAKFFGSGMAAIAAVVMNVVHAGDHIVATNSIYNHTYKLLAEYLPQFDVMTTFVDITDIEQVEAAIRPNTRLLYLESPGNPTMQLADLQATVDLAQRYGLVTAMDNSMATPFNQQPLTYGVDLVVHSATKYLGGHSDVVAGVVAGSRTWIDRLRTREHADLGGIIGPFEAWLVLRGIRTLGLRMKAHNAHALQLAQWLEQQPGVRRVHYPYLPSHPQYQLACRQMAGGSGIIGVVLDGGLEAARCFVNNLRLFSVAVSWGGFESLALPMWNSAMPEDMRRMIGLDEGFVRLSIGLEDVEDLQEDLARALAKLRR
jgi:methionine-gamma-lyase